MRDLRTIAAIVGVVGFGFGPAYREAGALLAVAVRGGHPPGLDPVGPSEVRFARLRARLPGRGVVGYRGVGPLRVGPNLELVGRDDAIARFVLAQYALAPLALDPNPEVDQPLVVFDGPGEPVLAGPAAR